MKKTSFCFLAASFLLLSFAALAGDSLQLTKSTVDSGGGKSTGGTFALRASIGQADAGKLRGASYQLQGGFWASDHGDFLFIGGFEEI